MVEEEGAGELLDPCGLAICIHAHVMYPNEINRGPIKHQCDTLPADGPQDPGNQRGAAL